ncbi:hypothetical protein ACFQKF_22200 [Halalkalicoccus sp. GCM10025322]|uniref:hypothetical protein n=1 Tax=Halalkalicoccus TaxID=332246 RepID=UPI002F96572E
MAKKSGRIPGTIISTGRIVVSMQSRVLTAAREVTEEKSDEAASVDSESAADSPDSEKTLDEIIEAYAE